MKSKYHFALKFFHDTKNFEQLELCYKEIEGFLNNFNEFKFFIELNLNKLDEKLEAQLDYEERSLVQSEDFQTIFNDYRLRNCETVFSSYNYNFELFKFALEKIFEDERKEKEKIEAKEKERIAKEKLNNPSKGYSYGFWVGVVFFTAMVILLGSNYNKMFI
jgi:hypothetical protein